MTNLEEMDNFVGSLPAPEPYHVQEGCLDCRSTKALAELVEFAKGVEKLTTEAFSEAMEYRVPDSDATVQAGDLSNLLRILKGDNT